MPIICVVILFFSQTEETFVFFNIFLHGSAGKITSIWQSFDESKHCLSLYRRFQVGEGRSFLASLLCSQYPDLRGKSTNTIRPNRSPKLHLQENTLPGKPWIEFPSTKLTTTVEILQCTHKNGFFPVFQYSDKARLQEERMMSVHEYLSSCRNISPTRLVGSISCLAERYLLPATSVF